MTRNTKSTLDRWIEQPSFKNAVDKEYKDFLLSELILALMENDSKSVRELAKAIGVSKTVIQNVRSGKQNDMKVSNFLNIVEACGFNMVLEKGDKRISL